LFRLIIDPSGVAAITAIARGPFGEQGPWHSESATPPEDGLGLLSTLLKMQLKCHFSSVQLLCTCL